MGLRQALRLVPLLAAAIPLAAGAGLLCIPAVEISPNITSSPGFAPCPPGMVSNITPISNALTIDTRGWPNTGGPRVTGLDAGSVGGAAGMAGQPGAGRWGSPPAGKAGRPGTPYSP